MFYVIGILGVSAVGLIACVLISEGLKRGDRKVTLVSGIVAATSLIYLWGIVWYNGA
jgi:hypothetical protein